MRGPTGAHGAPAHQARAGSAPRPAGWPFAAASIRPLPSSAGRPRRIHSRPPRSRRPSPALSPRTASRLAAAGSSPTAPRPQPLAPSRLAHCGGRAILAGRRPSRGEENPESQPRPASSRPPAGLRRRPPSPWPARPSLARRRHRPPAPRASPSSSCRPRRSTTSSPMQAPGPAPGRRSPPPDPLASSPEPTSSASPSSASASTSWPRPGSTATSTSSSPTTPTSIRPSTASPAASTPSPPATTTTRSTSATSPWTR